MKDKRGYVDIEKRSRGFHCEAQAFEKVSHRPDRGHGVAVKIRGPGCDASPS